MKSEREINAREISEVDLAFHILKQRGEPIYFRELITEILRIKPVSAEQWSRAAAAIYTQLNLDTRFSYLGEGRWTLRQGQPTKNVRRIQLVNRVVSKDPFQGGVKTRLRMKTGKDNEGSGIARHLELIEWRTKEEDETLEDE